MKKPELIYIYPSKSSFIASDIDFLSKSFEVKTQNLVWGNPSKLIQNLISQLLFLLKNGFNSKTFVISFAGYFSFFPVLFGNLFNKKTLIILNGTECIYFPEYKYGSLRKKIVRFFIKTSLKNASLLLPVHKSLVYQQHTFDKSVKNKEQGFQYFFKSVTTPFKIIPNGFDTNFWNYNAQLQQKKGFISVALANKKETTVFKGVDLILKIAKKHLNLQFTIVGLSKELQQQFSLTKNIRLLPFTKKHTLKKLYQEHQYYFQLSINEGFGCSLAEAMLCGCIPIVSNSGALPDVSGNIGFLVKHRSLSDLEKTIKKALFLSEEEKTELSKQSREHIAEHFSLTNREVLLLQEIQEQL